jgi:hypothetical protein
MLSRRVFPVFVGPALVSAVLLSGCVIVSGSGSSGAGSSDASGTSGTSGGGGFGGDDGQTTVTTSQTGSTASGTGVCVGSDGVGTVSRCEELNIAPSQGATKQCGVNKDELPPGYNLCLRGYSLFTNGSADELQSCLALIGVQNECDIPPVQDCVDQMFADACVAPEVADNCQSIATKCAGEAFDVTKCADDLRPFSNDGLTEILNCFSVSDPKLTCQQAYDSCYDQVFTF